MSYGSFWLGKKTLVGGGCGFLGSYLVPQLVEAGATVTVVDNLDNGYIDNLDSVADEVEVIEADLRDATVCKKFTAHKDLVINLAAKAYGMAYSRAHNGEVLVDNLLSTLTPLDAARLREGYLQADAIRSSRTFESRAGSNGINQPTCRHDRRYRRYLDR